MMTECFCCGEDMTEVDGCTEDRKIVFSDGEETDPIPYRESSQERKYQEVVEAYNRLIESGGQGGQDADHFRQELKHFKQQWEAKDFDNRECHDCGAKLGEYHHPGCDSEECPRCGGQYFICDCRTNEKKRIWDKS